MNVLRGIVTVVVVYCIASVWPEIATACPNCKEAYAADGMSSVATGFSTSILFLMSMPFLVVAGFALRLWFAMRKLHDTRGVAEHMSG